MVTSEAPAGWYRLSGRLQASWFSQLENYIGGMVNGPSAGPVDRKEKAKGVEEKSGRSEVLPYLTRPDMLEATSEMEQYRFCTCHLDMVHSGTFRED